MKLQKISNSELTPGDLEIAFGDDFVYTYLYISTKNLNKCYTYCVKYEEGESEIKLITFSTLNIKVQGFSHENCVP